MHNNHRFPAVRLRDTDRSRLFFVVGVLECVAGAHELLLDPERKYIVLTLTSRFTTTPSTL